MTEIAAYGVWQSPITTEKLTEKTLRLGQVEVDGDTIYWTEGRPEEKGRLALMSLSPSGNMKEHASDYSVRTTVHEYGGGSFGVDNGLVLFTHFTDQCLYSKKGEVITKITKEGPFRYSEPLFDEKRSCIYAICEEHTKDDILNYIAEISLDGKVKQLVSGADFYGGLALSPSGDELAYISWNHPNLPWDETELSLRSLETGKTRSIAGGKEISICPGRFSQDGTFYFISDESGWWNFYSFDGQKVEQITNEDVDFGGPLWILGHRTFDIAGDDIYSIYTVMGRDSLAKINRKTGEITQLELPFTLVQTPFVCGEDLVFLAATPSSVHSLYKMNLATLTPEVIRASSDTQVEEKYLSLPEKIPFPTGGEKTAYGYFYPPKNDEYDPKKGEKPPLIVTCHGGPTAHAWPYFSLKTQFWTSRGFAVFDVNYGGSTGNGREYRERLKGNWGIVDVEDAVKGAEFLAQQGLVDGNRMVIRGGSAGGYTVLCSLAFYDVFKGGTSLYGVSDLEALANFTHKFEQHYSHGLVGPYPEMRELYKQRSPANHADKINCPVLFLQGDEDKIVPPEQSELMVEALKKKGVPVTYKLFEGEQHGFRKAETIREAYDSELSFYKDILSLD